MTVSACRCARCRNSSEPNMSAFKSIFEPMLNMPDKYFRLGHNGLYSVSIYLTAPALSLGKHGSYAKVEIGAISLNGVLIKTTKRVRLDSQLKLKPYQAMLIAVRESLRVVAKGLHEDYHGKKVDSEYERLKRYLTCKYQHPMQGFTGEFYCGKCGYSSAEFNKR